MEKVKTRWGYWIERLNVPKMRVKTLVIEHGKSISYQYHNHRSEHWKILSGYGIMLTAFIDKDKKERGATLEDLVWLETKFLEPDMEVEIPQGMVHKVIAYNCYDLYNSDARDLVISEIQIGDILTEDDIVRLENIDESI